MNITTRFDRHSVRTSAAFAMAAAVLMGASACGSEHAADQAPGSLRQASKPTPSGLSSDVEECLVEQAKSPGASLHCWELIQPGGDGREGPVLAPNGRPVPLPGGTD